MGARRQGRERALQALYQLEMAQTTPLEALDAAWTADDDGGPAGKPDPEARKFAAELVEGVWKNLKEIDGLIQEHSHNWRVDRMSRIDRNVLRLAIFELRFRPEIPRKVTLNEAIELGKNFGAEESAGFINGLLDRVATVLGKP
ncbi:MAG: transcription antitermination factor NusB [Myxococcota bacterium]|nr:transcription antitermination factor NusB [Myxococcota bacterium]